MEVQFLGRTIWPLITLKRGTPVNTTTSERPATWLYDAFGAVASSTGISITPEIALQFSAVYACEMVISDQIAAFPKQVIKRKSDGVREVDSSHPVFNLINSEPNPYYSAFDLWHSTMISVLGWGNGFIRIIRDQDYMPKELYFVPPNKVTIFTGVIDGQFILFYRYDETGENIPARDMLHFKGLSLDGIQGKGVIANYATESVGLSIAAEKFGAKFFGNDTLMTKYLSHPSKLSKEAQDRLKDSWQKANAGLENAFIIKILEEGMELKNIGIAPEQAQFIATRQHQVEEICRWFKVQPHLIQHLLRSTNNNIEHQGIEFVTQTLTPWVVRFEQEIRRKLFFDNEKKKYYIKFNMNSLLRGDVKARGEYYTKLSNIGVLNPNEIRELEDMNPREGGDKYMTPMNMTSGNDNTQEDGKEGDQ